MLAVALALMAGCVLPDQFSKLQKDVAAMNRQLQELEQEQQAVNASLEQVRAEVATPQRGSDIGRSEFADVKLRLGEINRQQSILDERLIEVNRRVDHISQDVQENRQLFRATALGAAAPAREGDAATGQTAAVIPGSSAGRAALPGADDLYHNAYADFSKGNYALAISGFEEYALRYADSDRADNAMYWIGECYYSQGNHVVAVEAFDRMLQKYPDSDRTAAANLKKGLAYLEQNQIRPAIIQLKYVEEEFPGSDEARVAREKLGSLGAG
jgi:tol-pal system protein YbgF